MEKIAVVGLSCLFPDAESPERFWQNLVQGKDSTSDATVEEFGVDPNIFYGKGDDSSDKTYSLKGGFIRNFQFDPSGYALSEEKIAGLDPIAKASLYAAREALRSSGHWDTYWQNAELRDKCGVILGNLSLPLHQSNRLFGPMYQAAVNSATQELLNHPEFRLKGLPGGDAPNDPLNARPSSLPSHIVAEALSLSRLNFALDAACSSSLYAVELASHYLRSGEADLMLAGAASYTDSLFIRMLFSGLQAYPDNGVSCPFDQQSRGLTPADGVGMLVLKRYSDAVRDGDHIHAIVSSVGLSNDGRGKHLLSPNQKGQVLAFERAYEAAGFAPNEVDYVECHATGTLLGDTTELKSIDTFFHEHQARPLVGASKANTGHLLTAAGMVGLLKVILGMENGLIPPTINLKDPQISPNGVVTRDRIVMEPTPWPETGRPKRTALNAFGFGGTNAHLVLEETPKVHPAPTDFVPYGVKSPLAIVGMDACFGAADSLDALDRSFYDGIQQFRPLPEKRWKGIENHQELLKTYGFESGEAPQGAYLDSVDIDPIRYKIPPNEVARLHPQQLLMLKVADQALQDADIKPGDNVAVIVAMETDLSIHQLQQRWHFDWQVKDGLASSCGKLPEDKLESLTKILKDSLHPPAHTSEFVGYIGNIMPSRISALWDFNAPSFTLSAGEDSALKALEVAQNLLAYGHADAVLVGAVDLAAGFEQVLLRNQVAQVATGNATLSLDQKAQGAMVGEGAGAVVLKRLEVAQADGDRIYSVVDALEFAKLSQSSVPGEAADPNAGNVIAQACTAAYGQAKIATDEIGYLEVCGSGVPQADSAEIAGITQAYTQAHPAHNGSSPSEAPDLSCALGSATANIGYTGVAAAMASLIKTSLCLYHRYIPAVPNWSAPQQSDAWKQTPFYVAQESRGWLLGAGLSKRRAALNHVSLEGGISHLVMSEDPAQIKRPSSYLEKTPFHLFPIAGRDRADLEAKLTAFQQALEASNSLAALARDTFRAYRQDANLPYALTLVGDQKKKLVRDIGKAIKSVGNAFETGKDWQTPGGSFFTANPQGDPQGAAGQVAFVYPGAFGCFVGQARDRFRSFPDIFNLPMLEHLGERLNRVDRLIYPRSLNAFTRRELEGLDAQLQADPITMFEAETGCSGFTTAILQNTFKLQPQMALGYSLGETSMMLAQGVFEDEAVGTISERLSQSALFRDRISGAKNAVRDHWGMPLVSRDDGQDLWSNYVVVASPADVKAAVAQFKQVYVTQINTANEVVIAGLPASCQQVIELLGCQGFRAPFNHVIHCPAMASEHDEFFQLNAMTVKPPAAQPSVKLYSAANYQTVPVESHAIGDAVATNLCNQLDFPRLVNQIYNDGARIFVEVGAGMTCARWISENLADRPHLSVSLNRRGSDDHSSLVRSLARLVSHRVPLDLMPLYGDVDAAAKVKRKMVKQIPVGGPSIADSILSEANRALFKDVVVERIDPPVLETPQPPDVKPEVKPEPVAPVVPVASVPVAPAVVAPAVVAPAVAVPVQAVPNIPQPLAPAISPKQPEPVHARTTVPATDSLPQPSSLPASLPTATVASVDETLLASQAALGQAHAAFLQNRQASLQSLRHLIEQQLTTAADADSSNGEMDEPH